MSIIHLKPLLEPHSVALIGASIKPHSIGNVVLRNLRSAGFAGPIWPVNPKYDTIEGNIAYRDTRDLPEAPDLAVICTPAPTVPAIIQSLGMLGTRAAVVISAGFHQARLREQLLCAAQPYKLRILGPNCIGLLTPKLRLNASFAHIPALPGRLALLSQSGGICTAVLDWARDRNIGFSHFVSLGDSLDVDVADLLDYLGCQADTSGILLYLESVTLARKFLSAARAASRLKPVVAIKAGRYAAGARAAASHTGALMGGDEVFDAAIRRAGMLRVYELEELFDAVETLAYAGPIRGERSAILTNGGGPAVLATDTLIGAGGQLAELAPATLTQLDQLLPATWSRGNPIDIIGDADGERYARALRILLDDPTIDNILVLHVPTALSANDAIAQTIIPLIQGLQHKRVLVSWLGGAGVARARQYFHTAGIPSYDTPTQAVLALMQMIHYRRNQTQLTETPPSLPEYFQPDSAAARQVIMAALSAGRTVLTEPEAKQVLAAYQIPVVATTIATSVESALQAAENLGYPVALKVLSPEISHKSDVGGVVLDLDSPEALRTAANAMLARVAMLRPDAQVTGFTVQAMARREGALELLLGMAIDPIFGPAIVFGQGGIAVEVIADKAVTLPPLNLALAEQLMARTRIDKLLHGYRQQAPADRTAIALTLVKLTQLISDIPEIVELDINPLIADHQGVLALDARIKVAAASQPGSLRLAIRPYPIELEEYARSRHGQDILLRPIRPEDEPAHLDFLRRLAPEDVYFRFFTAVSRFDHEFVARYTQIDYNREMAFIAIQPESKETLGVVRMISNAEGTEGEFAIIIRSDWKNQGLGYALLGKLIRYCRDRGMHRVYGECMAENIGMQQLGKALGFQIKMDPQTKTIRLELVMTTPLP